MLNATCYTRQIIKSTAVLMMLTVFCLGGVFADSSAPPQQNKPRLIQDIAVDSVGNIYILDSGRDEVIKLDKDGKLIWQTSLATTEILNSNSYKLAPSLNSPITYFILSNSADIRGVDANGQLYPALPSVGGFGDRILGMDGFGALYFPNKEKQRVEKFVQIPPRQPQNRDLQPKFADITYPCRHSATDQNIQCSLVINGDVKDPERFAKPQQVISNPKGDWIWILDKRYIFNVYDGNGKFLYQVHAPDKKNRSFTYVRDAEFDAYGNVYLICQEAHAILEYNHIGKLIKKIPTHYGQDGFALSNKGNLYTGVNECINLLDGSGRCLPAIGVLDTTGKLIKTIPVPTD